MRDIQDFDHLKIKLASSDDIHAWSYGEVKKPETINYRTLKPEKDGLFCERIFGTTKEWECCCGKFKSIRYKGVICDRCGVEVTHFSVRRERIGHIDLAAPVSHIWYYRSVPSRIGKLLDLQVTALRSVLYYEKYIVIEPGDTTLKKMDLLTEDEYNENLERYGGSFTAMIGAEAIKTLLENLDLEELAAELRATMIAKGAKTDKNLLKRIEIVENFLNSGNKASWMILDVIPVIPPELRPMVQLDGGRFAASDLNDLYRRVINRNNRLRRLLSLSAPDIIIRNEKRMLQEAVDALFDNSKRKRSVKGASNRPLKSISDMLKGKQGRFRQNLLGKRVDYSGRSVIVVGPELKLWQCGLPTKMALELFKPFIIKKLVDKKVVFNIKKAKILVDQEVPEVFAILEDVVREHPVMLNRAPTLHRLGIQAFEPVLVQGKALKLHPLACKAFNADFDGDQMAIHVPLTQAAQMECWTLMLSARNLLDPANGGTIVYPSQDMVLGIYYMTKVKPNAKGTGKRFAFAEEAFLAAEKGYIDWEASIEVPAPRDSFPSGKFNSEGAVNEETGLWEEHSTSKTFIKGDLIKTTAARLRFNEEMPEGVCYVNKLMGSKELQALVEEVFHTTGPWLTIKMLDAIKATGYKNATFFGATLSMADIIVPKEKKQLVEEASKEVEDILAQIDTGALSDNERHNRITDIWAKTNATLTKKLMEDLRRDKDGFNTICLMADSGARGSPKQISQLAGMRGLMAKPNGDIIELPILSNFREGLSVIEFFISTSGARKGLSDTALKTADAGYMTRRLVDVAQDVVIKEEDCGTINGLDYAAVKNGDTVVESLKDRIIGRFTIERVIHPITGEVLCDVNSFIDEDLAAKIEEAGVEKVKLRSVLTCESKQGVCVKCYGRDLARNKIVAIGEAVGTIAAQSIGQPGTQLTMRTFHVGGTASKETQDNHIVVKYPVKIQSITGVNVPTKDGKKLFTRKGKIEVTRIWDTIELSSGDKLAVESGTKVLKGGVIVNSKNGDILAKERGSVFVEGNKVYLFNNKNDIIEVSNGSIIYVNEGDYLENGAQVGEFDAFSEPIIAEQSGVVHYEDIIPGATVEDDTITDEHLDVRQPRFNITDEPGNPLESHYMPAGAKLMVKDGDFVEAGTILAKLPKAAAKTSDITGGLPRVSELFEARKPKEPAILAQVSGKVRFAGISKGKRIIKVVDHYDKEFDHQVPMSKRLLVREGDQVEAGEPLTDGAKTPHDILAILGENELQRYLMDEIQGVYRSQGVKINDKHIGIIIRQMLRKVEIKSVGDTRFIYGQQVDKYTFHEQNKHTIAMGGEPAIARPMFQGITKAALNTSSFISAASFQETTKVLTNAAISGAEDKLNGLKENVVIGHMIPAGTGIRNYRNIKLFDPKTDADLDVQMEEIVARRRLEQEQKSREEEPSFETEED